MGLRAFGENRYWLMPSLFLLMSIQLAWDVYLLFLAFLMGLALRSLLGRRFFLFNVYRPHDLSFSRVAGKTVLGKGPCFLLRETTVRVQR
jgi:hypothetical protein